jgi:3-oxoacyl-[acyl-carrier protein] reductase
MVQDQKIVLVTGASRGIGQGLAERFASLNYKVVGVARSPLDEWQESSAQNLDRLQCDLTNESEVRILMSTIRKKFGAVDVLINNAGISSSDVLLATNSKRFEDVLKTNLVAAHNVTREAVKGMVAKSYGRTISISSIAARVPLAGNGPYAISKLALESLMKSYSVEFKKTKLTFNSVAVSFVEETSMVESLRVESRENYETRLLKPRPVSIDEIMHCILFFLSDLAESVTGQSIVLGSPS